MKRIANAFKVGMWAYKNAQTLNPSNFKMLSDLLGLILKVSSSGNPVMSHIAFVHPDDNSEHRIVSIWAGPSVDSCPTKRISELLEENRKLSNLLSQSIKS